MATNGETVRNEIKARIVAALTTSPTPVVKAFYFDALDLEVIEPQLASPDNANFIHYWSVSSVGGEFRVHRQVQMDNVLTVQVQGFYTYDPTEANETAFESAVFAVLKAIFGEEFRNVKKKLSANPRGNVPFTIGRVILNQAILRRVEFSINFEASF